MFPLRIRTVWADDAGARELALSRLQRANHPMTSIEKMTFAASIAAVVKDRQELWPQLPTTLVIDDHIGGPNNHGFLMARYYVEQCRDYPEYAKRLQDELREKHGDTVMVYRSAPARYYQEEIACGSNLMMSTTTSLDYLKTWNALPMNKTETRVCFKMEVCIEDVVFEGHCGECELVVRHPVSVEMLERRSH